MNKEEIPEPILLEDLGMIFATKNSKYKFRFGLYRCGLCGNEFKTVIANVKRKHTNSCGCYNKIKVSESTKKHGLFRTRLYNIWTNMKMRVYNPKNTHYKDYGGRGITICDEWKNDFMSFHHWAMSNGYSDELSIDRIDNDGNYEPNNCRWTTKSIQSRNQRIRKNNSSGYRGVSFKKDKLKYKAYLNLGGKQIHIGYFTTPEEAGIAYNNYIIENNLEGYILNEIPESIKQCSLN